MRSIFINQSLKVVWRSKIWLGITRISALMAFENPVVRTSSNQSNLGRTLNWTWGSVWEIFWTSNWTWGSVLDGLGLNWSSGLNFSTTIPNLHPVPLLSRTCIGLAPILLSLLPFASLLSCITFRCYISWHWTQPQDTSQQQPFLHYFSSRTMLVRPKNGSTPLLTPRHYLYYPIPHSVLSLSD